VDDTQIEVEGINSMKPIGNMMIYKKICIQPIGNSFSESLREVIEYLYSKLQNHFEHVVVQDLMEIPPCYNPIRKQYNSNCIVKAIKSTCDLNIGILEEDIYSAGLNFVFGLAEIGGKRAVVSIHRLKPEFYGLEEDYNLLNERTLKEVMHETGHLLGLGHCDNPKCVMHFSNSIFDTDIKSWNYCKRCANKLK